MGLFAGTTVILALSATPAAGVPAAATVDSPAPLVLRPKSALAAAVAAPRGHAPFMNPSTEVDLEPLTRPDPRLAGSPSSCSGERSLCYDPRSGRIVYRPARAFMPAIPGLTPENISVRRDRITFRYTF